MKFNSAFLTRRLAMIPALLILTGCQLGGDSGLITRERLKYGYTNELQTLRELREQLAHEEEVLEIFLSELDRNEEVALELRQQVEQTRGQVASLNGSLAAEKKKTQELQKQTAEEQKKQQEAAAVVKGAVAATTADRTKIAELEKEKAALTASLAALTSAVKALRLELAGSTDEKAKLLEKKGGQQEKEEGKDPVPPESAVPGDPGTTEEPPAKEGPDDSAKKER